MRLLFRWRDCQRNVVRLPFSVRVSILIPFARVNRLIVRVTVFGKMTLLRQNRLIQLTRPSRRPRPSFSGKIRVITRVVPPSVLIVAGNTFARLTFRLTFLSSRILISLITSKLSF